MCAHVSSGVTEFTWGVSSWSCVSVAGNIVRDCVSKVSLYAQVNVCPNVLRSGSSSRAPFLEGWGWE